MYIPNTDNGNSKRKGWRWIDKNDELYNQYSQNTTTDNTLTNNTPNSDTGTNDTSNDIPSMPDNTIENQKKEMVCLNYQMELNFLIQIIH